MLLTICPMLFFSQHAIAAPQRFVIDAMSLTTEARELFVNLSVTVDDEDSLHDMLKNGAIVELAVDLSMERERSWWSNSELTHVTYSSVVQHDPLTREFFLTPPNEGPAIKNRNLTHLLMESWEKLHLQLIAMSDIESEGLDKRYKVTATVSLRFKEIPPWLASSGIFWAEEIVPPVTFTLGYRYQ